MARKAYRVEPVRARIGRFLGLIGAIAVLSVGVVIVQRLTQEAWALLGGLSCGISAMAPLVGLLLFVWRRSEEEFATPRSLRVAPPMRVMSPPMLPGGYQNSWETSSRKAGAAQRESSASRERRVKDGR